MSGGLSAEPGRAGEAELLARVAWSALAEPGDVVAGAVVAALGPREALEWLRDAAARAEGRDDAADRLGGSAHTSIPVPGGSSKGSASDASAADGPDRARTSGDRSVWARAAEDRARGDRARLARAVQRWAPRLAECDPARDLEAADRLGARVITPSDADWPVPLGDLGPEAPPCLWVRGGAVLGATTAGSVALVGARSATTYGERVAYDLAAALTGRGRCVVSGGAYGIDAAAHRGAIASGGPTVVVLAGGIDRTYPVGNARLFDAALAAGGAVVSELAPGRLPTRSRFLQRNRLIAALGCVTVVVEAAWRSGALSTAHHAARLLRPVAAVPGPVTSMASAGCHRLLRDGVATCVTDVDEVLELVGPLRARPPSGAVERARPDDDLDPVARLVRDALPRRGAHDERRLAASAGVSVADVRASLGLLELAGLARRRGEGWCLER